MRPVVKRQQRTTTIVLHELSQSLSASRFFVQARDAKPPGQFGFHLGQRDALQSPSAPSGGTPSRPPRGGNVPGPPSPGSAAASTTSAASSMILAPIFSTPPASSLAVYDFGGGLALRSSIVAIELGKHG